MAATTLTRPSGNLGPARRMASTSCTTLERPTGRAFWTLIEDLTPKLGQPIQWIGESGEVVHGYYLGERWSRADGERNSYQPALWRPL